MLILTMCAFQKLPGTQRKQVREKNTLQYFSALGLAGVTQVAHGA